MESSSPAGKGGRARIARFLTSPIGRKVLMALTGLAMAAFLGPHLAGNLLAFLGAERYNAYGHMLISNPLVYVAEAVLLAIFILHFAVSFLLTGESLASRPVGYQVKRSAGGASRRSWASTTMILTGIVVLVFVPLHLWTFKFGPRYPSPTGDPHVRDLHRLLLEVFQNPVHVVWYVVAMAILGLHLWHAIGSAFESLGIPYRRWIRAACQVVAAVLSLGFVVIPLLIYLVMRGIP